ncbi:hypothetical protein HID58_093316 [Brassica napus]|uniref:Ethylene insensitive 3-like DNA-binding domain-containing protein n=1 Tax=Brassica napus TaxID=3708 RepID=A0ABQ7XE73_BRANA|nr:hypothetical protein HID58_093316 [Brassica napus]
MVEVEELEPLTPVEEEEEEVISYDDLKRRMWKDRNLMEKLKQQKRHSNDVVSLASHRAEASRRKKMARSQDSVLKYMMKIMEVCKAKGFVYGIVPDKGKPITGSSDSLRRWWKETVHVSSSAMGKPDDYDSNWMDYLWFERMQPEFNSSRRFDDDEDNPMVLNQSTESNQSDNVSQSIFSVWDMGCEDKDIYMFDY